MKVFCTVMVSAGAAGACLSGCSSGMGDIDARVKKAVEERSQETGIPVAPSLTYDGQEDWPRDKVTSKQLATTNPKPEDLQYKVASEARDVSARLEGYENRAMGGPDAMVLDLRKAFLLSQTSGREYKTAEEEYILAAIRLLQQRHLWDPRLFDTVGAGLVGEGNDGSFQTALQLVNELRVTQRLPYGGEISARWLVSATEQLREEATGRYQQTSELLLTAQIPLLQGAGLVAQEDLIQAERDLIYAARRFEDFRRTYLVGIARDYFDLIQAQAQIGNQERKLESVRQLEAATAARVDAGRVAAFQKNIAASDVRSALADLASQREGYVLAVDRFKVRLGIPVETPVRIAEFPLEIREPDVSPEEAAEAALLYRLDLQNQRDQVDDSKRGVDNAKNAILPSLNLDGTLSVPSDPSARFGDLIVRPEESVYRAGVTFGLPLDRENERLSLRQAEIALRQRERQYSEFRDNVVLTARKSVRDIELARFQYELAQQRVEINEQRQEELELKKDQVDSQTVLDAQNDLLGARNARDQALTDLRNAVLNYLRETGQLRVKKDGTFDPLPGMELPTTGPKPAEDLEPSIEETPAEKSGER